MEGFLSGLHDSPFHGFSVEFSDYRNYQPGDDLRHLDWRLYARSDRLCIKRYMQETNARFYVVCDTSASMKYQGGAAWGSKLECAKVLAAALTWFLLKQNDAAGMVTLERRERSAGVHPPVATAQPVWPDAAAARLAARDRRGLPVAPAAAYRPPGPSPERHPVLLRPAGAVGRGGDGLQATALSRPRGDHLPGAGPRRDGVPVHRIQAVRGPGDGRAAHGDARRRRGRATWHGSMPSWRRTGICSAAWR